MVVNLTQMNIRSDAWANSHVYETEGKTIYKYEKRFEKRPPLIPPLIKSCYLAVTVTCKDELLSKSDQNESHGNIGTGSFAARINITEK